MVDSSMTSGCGFGMVRSSLACMPAYHMGTVRTMAEPKLTKDETVKLGNEANGEGPGEPIAARIRFLRLAEDRANFADEEAWGEAQRRLKFFKE
jgi:hypothetical protein